ncbi:MAG: cupin domain-containing protein [Candidatus Altiarchaeota archaeon]|nr:cupin domain-containing protein [Candidatus Altiarchaeota archaeon]
MDLNEVKYVDKPWGREIHFALEKEYVGKILEVKKATRLSLQYHKKKKETMYLLSGKIKLRKGDEEEIISPGQSITIKPKDIHRVEAMEDARILEVSTNHLGDVVRLEDDYKR